MEEMGMSGDLHRAILGTAHTLDVSKSAHVSRQGAASNNTDSTHMNTSCGNIVIVENSLHSRGAPSSVIVPLNSQSTASILPLSNKLKISHKSMKAMPRITVNASNLHKLQQKGKPQSTVQKNPTANNDLDDDLGNILDIPIIFAKDDDSLSQIDKVPVVAQTTALVREPQERPKLSGTTKVVLISNKQDKLQQAQQQKFGAITTTATAAAATAAQAVICPAGMSGLQNLNHLILQTRTQSGNASSSSSSAASSRIGMMTPMENRPATQPTVKYTKIILAKRNTQPSQQQQQNKRTTGEPMIVAKRTEETLMDAPSKILTFERDENRYMQVPPTSNGFTSYENPFADNVLEIEDAIKTNIIERKYVFTPALDEASPATLDDDDDDDDCDILDRIKLNEPTVQGSEQPAFDNFADET